MADRRRTEPTSLLSFSIKDLEGLDPGVSHRVLQTINSYVYAKASQARWGTFCGAICFLACVAGFIYLIMHGHEKAAAALLGTAVLGFLGRFFKSIF